MNKTGNRKENLLEKTFGELKVISFVGVDKWRSAIWKCKCSCENTVEMSAKNIKRKKHCGCMTSELLSKNSRKPFGESCKNALVDSYKRNAKNRNLKFLLTEEDLLELFSGNCYYCGEPPSKEFTKARLVGSFTYNGIDRLNPNLGYIDDNVVSCCTECNYFKTKYSEEKFLSMIRKIANHKKLFTKENE